MAEVEYRAFKPEDALELMQVFGEPDSVFAARFRTALRASNASDNAAGDADDDGAAWVRSLVALDAGVPVGAAMVYTSAALPSRYPAYIEVAQDHQREGIGSGLLARIRAAAQDGPEGPLPLTAKVLEGSTGQEFGAHHGFETIQTSTAYVLKPNSLPIPELQEGTGMQLEEAALGSVELSQSVATFFTAMHADWSPVELSVGAAQARFLSEASGALGAVVLRDKPRSDGGNILAFAISYQRPEDMVAADVFLGYEPQLSLPDAQDALEKLLALLAYKEPVQFEVESSMRALADLASRLQAQGALLPVDATCLIIADDAAAEH